jgi:hypothetical protein
LKSTFPAAGRGFEGGDIIASGVQAIVVVDILRGKGFKALGSSMLKAT